MRSKDFMSASPRFPNWNDRRGVNLAAMMSRSRRPPGLPDPAGESGYTSDERRWARPSLDINGLTAGHQGVGVKTVLPATASAKFSFRLVPDQDPRRITELIRSHLQKHQPPGVRFELKPDHGAPAMVTDAAGTVHRCGQSGDRRSLWHRPGVDPRGGFDSDPRFVSKIARLPSAAARLGPER